MLIMKKRVFVWLWVALLALGAVADQYDALLPEAARNWPRQFLDSQSWPVALAGGNVYIVTNDVTFIGGFVPEGEEVVAVTNGPITVSAEAKGGVRFYRVEVRGLEVK